MACHKQRHHNFPFHTPLVNTETEWQRETQCRGQTTKKKRKSVKGQRQGKEKAIKGGTKEAKGKRMMRLREF